MKTTEFEVRNLNENELKEINGGAWWPFIVGYILVEAALNPTAHINALVEGYNSAVNTK